jgi:hypothetical protein
MSSAECIDCDGVSRNFPHQMAIQRWKRRRGPVSLAGEYPTPTKLAAAHTAAREFRHQLLNFCARASFV